MIHFMVVLPKTPAAAIGSIAEVTQNFLIYVVGALLAAAIFLTLMRQGGWKRLQVVERYSDAIPVKDRTAPPNPLGEAKILSFRREAKVV